MKKPGWRSQMVFLSLAASLLTSWSVLAAPITIRDISFKDDSSIQVQFDAALPRGSVDIDFVRDIIQFTIKNATIYPAKIIHTDSSRQVGFSKLFAYQYSPNIVRIRLTVEGDATQYRKSFQWSGRGKAIHITVPQQNAKLSESKEKSLLAKVLGDSDPAPAPKVEKKSEVSDEKPLGKKIKSQTVSEPNESLGGAQGGPSVFRSFLAMFLVVGGLGLVLIYVKQRKNTSQARRVGDSWISGILGNSKSKKALIEVVSTHPLGPKQSITVVRIRDQQFVLGVTQDSVQLITQLDSDEVNADVLEDPKVVDSIGKIFGAKPAAPQPSSSFQSMLKGSTGANAIIGRSAYQAQTQPQVSAAQPTAVSASAPGLSARDRIKQHLQGARS